MRRWRWSGATVLLVITGTWLWWRLAGPGAPAPRGLDLSRDLGPLERQLLVVQRFAPVFLQNRKPKRTRTDNGEAYEDHFVRIDYDGDWNGFDNSANLKDAATHNRDLSAHVYYGVQETARHYYLHFAYFHPRDPKWFGFHENDVEGGMVVVRKAASWTEQLTRQQLVMVQAQAHNRFAYRKADELCVTAIDDPIGGAECGVGTDSNKTHPILVSQAGSGWLWNHGHGTEIPRSRDRLSTQAFVYVPGEAPDLPTTPPERAVAYKLVSLTGDRDGDGQLDNSVAAGASEPGLWDRRFDTRVYGRAAGYPQLGDGARIGHGLQSGDGCKANLPWGWFGMESNVPHGMFFLDPARALARAMLARYGVEEPPGAEYVSNVYLKGTRIPGTSPVPTEPVFKCDCAHMMTAFDSSTAWGMDLLEHGPGCTLVARELAPAVVARVPRAARWTTCDELEEWVSEEEREAVERVGVPNDDSCALLVKGGTYLRLPSRADKIPLGDVSRLPRLFSPERYSALRVTARVAANAAGYDLGGFWLHRGGNYDESMATVPFFARQPLVAGAWQTVNLVLGDSPHFRSADDVVLLAIGPDVGTRFAVTSAEVEALEVGDLEIDTIELVPAASARGLRTALPPLAITGIDPARARFGELVTIRGSGFATPECGFDFVTFGDSILRITGCSASSITVEANGVGEAVVRVRTSGGRVAEAEQRLVIEVEP